MIRPTMSLNLPRQSALFDAPFRSLAIEEGGVDSSVESVQVHRLDTVLKIIVLNLETFNRLVVTETFILLAVSKCLVYPLDDLAVHPKLS
ncbi:MAG TPA: hypothetical protein VN982_17045 [Candidatus Dormibacteraeota bacterium]|nr:hypothetical protein [Candidatus Dormibacteraeota bacterium]